MQKNGKDGRFRFSGEQKAAMVAAIQDYFLSERQETLGNLAAALLLEFITEKLAPEFYNRGVADAYRYMSERCEDLLSIQI